MLCRVINKGYTNLHFLVESYMSVSDWRLYSFARALEFTVVFLQQIVDDHKAGKHTDSMHAFCVHAYDTTLRSYHTWILQKVFPVSTLSIHRELGISIQYPLVVWSTVFM